MASTNSRVKASPAPTATRTDLAPVLQPYIEAALADRTRQEYRADLRRFLRWGGTLPASPDVLATYLVAHATDHAMATMQRWLVSLGRAHTSHGRPDPT